MKIFNKISVAVVVVSMVFTVVGFTGPGTALALGTPSLGAAATYGILSSSYINTAPGTTVTGDIGYTTPPAVPAGGVHTYVGSGYPYSAAATAQGNVLSLLDGESCTHIFPSGAVDLSTVPPYSGTYTSGVYCTDGAASIGSGGITLSGPGTFIFRVNGALTTVTGSVVRVENGASACDVFWTPRAATTLDANTTFLGTNIDPSGITIGSTVSWTGRALAYGGTVSTDVDTIIAPLNCAADPAAPAVPAAEVIPAPSLRRDFNTITVVKQVINDSGGTANFADFPLFVNGYPVGSGQSISNSPGFYTVTETSRPGYVTSFTGDCDASGVINHGGTNSQNDICTVVNNDVGAPAVPVVPPLIDVVKVPSPLSLPAGPGDVTYTYTATNIGTVPMTDVTMVGDTCSPIVLASGDTNGDSKLDVDETWVYTCTKRLVVTTKNTVTATGHANGLTAIDVASATVVVGLPVVPPLIHITKVPSPLALPAGAGQVTYTKEVTNPGTVALSNVTVTDDRCSPVRYISGDTNGDSKLDPTETWTYTCKVRLTETTTNTATARGEANGLVARDFALATVVVAVPKLPNTGVGSDVKGILWNIIMPIAVLMSAIVSLVMVSRKRRA